MASQREIEAAADAMKASMFAPHELPITDVWLNERYADTARAALLAAERVREDEAREKLFGCHCDCSPGEAPDSTCFLDYGPDYRALCGKAPKLHREGKPKTACEYWRQYDPADYAKEP